ncbi:urease accessory protein UreH domain-containing protein [Streptosporangium sp. H16]|uniref:sulfite exporter TauE/SafE family protein n=1 Tax=Streptosporangium sp. H16 TaxID=3444184 RepID=UPI003F7B1C23
MVRGDLDGHRGCPLSAGPAALFAGGLAAGLVAGTASCAAVQGGLLTGLTSRRPAGSGGLTSRGRPAGSGGRGGTGAGPSDPTGPTVVALFLAGRLGSHTAAGALLGLAGSAVRLGPQVRAALLVAAGIAVVFFGIRMFGREPEDGCRPDAPPGGRASRRGGVSGIAAPAPRALALGAATILLPCGVTLSTEMVAVSSGSALGGAAVMAGFVTGTAPAFALLGLVLRRAATTRLAALAGVVALAAGLWTISSGLSLGGWLPGSGGPATAADGPARPMGAPAGRTGTAADDQGGDTAAVPAGTAVRAGGVQRVEVRATGHGYRPGVVTAHAGVPTDLVFRLEGVPGCTRTLTIDGRDVALPATVRLGAREPGSLRYVCSMGMYVGFVRFV